MKIKIVPFIILFCFSLKVKAQDPIFTQYFMVPETFNPGFTGFLETTNAGILHKPNGPTSILGSIPILDLSIHGWKMQTAE